MPRKASLSLDLLKTFVAIVDNKGNASRTAEQLEINQPSMSKRLRYLQHTSGVLERYPWLVREGKTWKLTEEGQRVLPAVHDLINRYEQLIRFVEEPISKHPYLAFSCGRHAVLVFVQAALRKFRRKHADVFLRVFTLRGEARITGVANGSLDLATVDYDEEVIAQIARRPLHVEPVATHRLGLICSRRTPWARKLAGLPKTKAGTDAFTRFPLILPEPDAGIRKMLDPFLRNVGLAGKMDVRLEVGGWGTILSYVRDGHGVGLISESAVPQSEDLVVRYFDPATIPARETKIICRYKLDTNEPDLSPVAADLYTMLKETASKNKK